MPLSLSCETHIQVDTSMQTILHLIFIISSLYNTIFVNSEDEKRLLLNDPATIQSQLHQYETQLNKYGTSLQQMEGKMAALESEIAKLRKENDIMNSSFARLRTENRIMNDTITKFQGRISALETNNNPNIQKKSMCSFYVSLSHDLHLLSGITVVFDKVYFNENNCYNNGDGIFVASSDGLYIFLWKITTHSGGTAGVLIKKNGKAAGFPLLVSANDDNLNHNSVSDFAILRLYKGDHVQLATDLNNTFIHTRHSGFGGFYIRQ